MCASRLAYGRGGERGKKERTERRRKEEKEKKSEKEGSASPVKGQSRHKVKLDDR